MKSKHRKYENPNNDLLDLHLWMKNGYKIDFIPSRFKAKYWNINTRSRHFWKGAFPIKDFRL
jgi:hypothetical protein